MKTYEGIFVFPPVMTAEEKKLYEGKLNEIIAKFEVKIVQRLEWGKRPLGYTIKKFSEGWMELFELEMAPSNVDGFKKALRLMPELVKFTITLKDLRIVRNPAPPKTKVPAAAEAPAAEV